MATEEYLEIRADQEEPTEYKDGFGLKAILGGLFVAFLVVPGSMFMFLMLGQRLTQAAIWVTLIIMLEITKRCRSTLTRQEMFVIHSVTAGMLAAGIGRFYNFIWMQYFVRSDAAIQFGVVDRLPFWVAPPPDSAAYLQRNLLHPDWWPMIALMAIGILWSRISFFSLGYALFRITSDAEKLPFPLAPIAAKGITALAESEEESWRWRCFSIGSTVGIAFGLIYVAIPTLTGVFLKKPLYLLPVPFYDFTTKMQEVKWLRAVPLALNTNLHQIFIGFVLPFWMVVASFVAGVLGRLVLNPILFRAGVLQRWEPGMDYIETGVANRFDFWLSFQIGTALAIAILGFYQAFRGMLNARKEGKDKGVRLLAPPKGRGDIPISISLLFYVAQTSWTILLAHWLVPKFPVWIMMVFGFGYTPIMSYVHARLLGLTGHRVGIPYARQATFILSGYKGVDIWRAPIPISGGSGGGAQQFRQIELTGTKFTSIYKAQFFVIPVSIVVSLLFWSFIYRMSDVPEDYPYAMRFWPRDAVMRAFWMTATTSGNAFFLEAFKLRFVGMGLAYGVVAYPILRILGAPTLLLYGTIRGLAGDPIDAVPELTAALIGRFYMARIFGKRRWNNFTPVLAAGFGCGIGLVGMVSMGMRLISSAVTMLPF
ncbi:MAG: peptide transporter [Candidatus Brocadiia bacterium]